MANLLVHTDEIYHSLNNLIDVLVCVEQQLAAQESKRKILSHQKFCAAEAEELDAIGHRIDRTPVHLIDHM